MLKELGPPARDLVVPHGAFSRHGSHDFPREKDTTHTVKGKERERVSRKRGKPKKKKAFLPRKELREYIHCQAIALRSKKFAQE